MSLSAGGELGMQILSEQASFCFGSQRTASGIYYSYSEISNPGSNIWETAAGDILCGVMCL